MTKQAKKSVQKKQQQNFFTTFSIDNYIPEKYQDLIFLIIPLLLLFIFFSEVLFGNKTFISGDITASKAMENYLAHAREVGSFPLWMPYIFLGMPAYIVEINLRSFDLILSIIYYLQAILVGITKSKVAGPMFYFYILSVSTYFFIKSRNVERWGALFGSIAVTFSTGMIIFLAIGHNTKMLTLCMIPLVFMILEKFRDRFSWTYFLLLIIALHIQFLSAHIQEIFYSFFAVLIYFIYFFVRDLIQKKKDEVLKLVRSGVVYIFASVIAAGMSIDQYWSIYEYNPFSIRGTQSIVEKEKPSQKKASGTGLDYEYATNWSFSPGEILTFTIPAFYGLGNSTYRGE
ncbi:MAG: hypothetical protein N3A61_06755, partial [Ignavibacteria bacterium]|nr:hypothetical protein [Ignavibacteria bacterium]